MVRKKIAAPVVFLTDWTPLADKQPFTIFIPVSKEASKEADTQAPQHVKVYTDGSAQKGKVGAAAILTKDRKEIFKVHYHLGKVEDHTVCKAELVGILLGLKLIESTRQVT